MFKGTGEVWCLEGDVNGRVSSPLMLAKNVRHAAVRPLWPYFENHIEPTSDVSSLICLDEQHPAGDCFN
jgi:hypothetical protein